jgi:hypothetical protein
MPNNIYTQGCKKDQKSVGSSMGQNESIAQEALFDIIPQLPQLIAVGQRMVTHALFILR